MSDINKNFSDLQSKASNSPMLHLTDPRNAWPYAADIGLERGYGTKMVMLNLKSFFIVSFFLYNDKNVKVYQFEVHA